MKSFLYTAIVLISCFVVGITAFSFRLAQAATLQELHVVCYEQLDDLKEIFGEFTMKPLADASPSHYQPVWIDGEKAIGLAMIVPDGSICGIWKDNKAE